MVWQGHILSCGIWVGFWSGFIGRRAGFVTQTWQPCMVPSAVQTQRNEKKGTDTGSTA